MNPHPAPVSPRAARSRDLKPLDALLVSLTAITGVLLVTLVLLALFSRHPSTDLLKMLAFLAMVFGGISLAFSRALVQVARPPVPYRKAVPASRHPARHSADSRSQIYHSR